jgi:hypothetical protein
VAQRSKDSSVKSVKHEPPLVWLSNSAGRAQGALFDCRSTYVIRKRESQ